MGWNYLDISTLPRVYDIVWCLFPVGQDGQPGPKLRPALVRQVMIEKTRSLGAIVVSYGTTQLRLGYKPHDLIIQNAAELSRLGLTAATRFDLGLMARIHWAAEFICPPPHAPGSVCTGHLSDQQVARMKAAVRRRTQLGLDNTP